MKKRFINFSLILLFVAYIFVLTAKPHLCRSGTFNGILLCGKVIIPSLFPFATCVLFILGSGIFEVSGKLTHLTKKITGLPFDLFMIFVFSSIGGYPVGASLLNTATLQGKITAKTAGRMLNFCINAGPAFIISAVGSGILGSQTLGIILLASHLFSSVLLLFVFRFAYKFDDVTKTQKQKPISFADNFVNSAAEASKSVLSICSFVILFSGICEYINYFAQKAEFLKFAALLLEVTNAVTFTNNLYLISFLLGFGGISVWCQIIFMAKNIKINFLQFTAFRILHGTLSALFTFILVKIFPSALPTVSNGKIITFSYFHSTAAIGISLLIMGIVFVISLTTKNYAGKLLDDMV